MEIDGQNASLDIFSALTLVLYPRKWFFMCDLPSTKGN